MHDDRWNDYQNCCWFIFSSIQHYIYHFLPPPVQWRRMKFHIWGSVYWKFLLKKKWQQLVFPRKVSLSLLIIHRPHCEEISRELLSSKAEVSHILYIPHTNSKQVLSMLCGHDGTVTKLSILKTHSIHTRKKPLILSVLMTAVNYWTIIHCTKEMKELLTAAQM